MPESPEVRVIADKLRPHLLEKYIIKLETTERAKFTGSLTCPIKIINVRSRGKKVVFDLESGQLIVASLGMTGKYLFERGNHSHIRFDIGDVQKVSKMNVLKPLFSIYFDDTRYFGNVTIGDASLLADLGPDLLQAAVEENWITSSIWIGVYTQKKCQNKELHQVFLDQNLIAGIGMYLCIEICYYAGVKLTRVVSTITQEEWEHLRTAAHQVVLCSYQHGGLTIESFLAPDGSLGLYPAAIYSKTHDPNGLEVTKVKLKGGRTGYYVEGIQH